MVLLRSPAIVVLLLALGTSVPLGVPQDASMPPGDKLSSARQEVDDVLGFLRHCTDPGLRRSGLARLLSAYVRLADVCEQGGNAEGAYQALLDGEAWEAMASSAGLDGPVVAPELARYRARLLYRDGRGLLVLLRSKALSSVQKAYLMELLERTVEREAVFPQWSPADEPYPSELPADVRAQLEAVRGRRQTLEGPAKEREEAAMELLDTYAIEMGILLDAGFPAQAEQVVLEGCRRRQHEFEEKFHIGGERSPVDYPAGEFLEFTLPGNGDLLLTYIHSPEVPKDKKDWLLAHMRLIFGLEETPP